MKVIVTNYTFDDGFSRSLIISACDSDGCVTELHFSEGEPEDATLLRDYRDCYRIPAMMLLAHEAGKRGEDLTVEVNEK